MEKMRKELSKMKLNTNEENVNTCWDPLKTQKQVWHMYGMEWNETKENKTKQKFVTLKICLTALPQEKLLSYHNTLQKLPKIFQFYQKLNF